MTTSQPTVPVPDSTTSDVAVLGLGAMGTALADALLDAGRSVTVWNRTPTKTQPLAARGATVAPTPADAAASAPVVIACLLNHQNVMDALVDVSQTDLSPAAQPILVDLTTTTPAEARRTATAAAEAGRRHLDGAIMAIPSMIGRPEAAILYSGDPEVYTEAEPTLQILGTSRHVGGEPGLASIRDLALLSAMYTTFAGLHQAVALAGSAGITAADLVPELAAFVGAMVPSIQKDVPAFDSGDHTTVGQDLVFTRNAVDLIVRAAREEGREPSVLTAVQNVVAGEVERGHGHLDTSAMIEAFRR
ncbi:NAD(P)-dependent oxidoreductase [Gordonia soli]|uniref:Uncharacterized protein n=1 Tax=Gordonia soli NBRC 108243 TaxID=1223545 RepID=M0QE29_9ACTN|nr:NAD(P)-binding domain-containing protein [Gordonia soli]GAC66581.1 hypothetical protein GS4_03_00290 [Gordonia soli NBRC 108243]